MRVLILCSLLLAVVVAQKCAEKTVFDSGNNLYYHFFPTDVVFGLAEEFCVRQKGHLVTISSVFQNMFFASVTKQQEMPDRIWIGLSNGGDKWNWIDGNVVAYTNWYTAPPSASAGKCATFEPSSGYWFSTDCNEKHQFVCATTEETTIAI